MATRSAYKWEVIGQTIRGASHLRNGLPNQDAIQFDPGDEAGAPVVVAVADGHGSPKSFRSAVGADLAARAALEITRNFLNGMKQSSLSAIKDAAERLLPADIVKSWTDAVDAHRKENPFSAEELDRLESGAGLSAREAIVAQGKHLVAYGSTLLLVAIADGFIFYLQLGDGDIVAVSDTADVAEHPLPSDPSLIANETTSLCMSGAQKKFRFRFQVIHDVPPALILISTDGYSNAFATDADFYKVGSDLIEIVRTSGLESVNRDLSGWLNDASQSGSGDDVTLGIICRSDLIGRTVEGEDK
jgi:serine/threonine protein phosphatase PrpC